ncbi:hypothetical protein BJY52DRAFT_1228705 [Lactarius psammicola]|nr:hypothetical protein BJY52DRAFT_1228705 [Lactarius psammicola]
MTVPQMHGQMILQALFFLAFALLERLKASKQPEDAIHAAKYLRHLRNQRHAAFGFSRFVVTTALVNVLALQVELEARNVVQDIEEMAVLCHELLTSDASDGDNICPITLFVRTFVNDDYEEAASILDGLITSSSPEDSQDEYYLVTALAVTRSKAHRTPEYSVEAIYRACAFLSSSLAHVEQPFHPALVEALEETAEHRFYYFGPHEGLEVSSSGSQPVPMVSWWSMNMAIRNSRRSTKLSKRAEPYLLLSTPRHPFASHLFEKFGFILEEAFERTKRIEYLNELIDTYRQVLGCPLSHILRFWTFRRFAHPLQVLFTQDLDEALELLSQCAKDGYASLPDRFQSACFWAFTCHSLAMSNDSHSMPLDYASYQVNLFKIEETIETLERGRALLWSEMRHLRTSVDQLLEAHPHLGHKFAAVNRDLEELTESIPPSRKLSVDDGAAESPREVDPFGRLLLEQRSLLKERDTFISQIQAFPGFDSFLTSPSFDTLRSAALSGPVNIINHSEWRSDILILLHNTSPSLIGTPANFYRRASALKDKLLNSRHKYGLDSNHYDQTLASVLAGLYKFVGKPVIDRLQRLKVAEQFRIWWCPTSVFCSLPLHAMGPIPSDDGEMRYFLDLYIYSYTPTLSALIQSRNPDFGSQCSDRPSLLLVAQPDPSLPTVRGEIQVVQTLDTEVTSLVSEAATPAAVIDSLHHHRFVHFACHAEVTEGSIVDEGLHFAAAVQYCRFRCVVGTMWAMVDEAGRDLAEHFYKALFSTSRREQGLPYHERSAKSIWFAVKKLRRKRRITLERWVNFVHYGA